MSLLNVGSKLAAGLATTVALYDVNGLGVRGANIKRESNYADDYIANTIGANQLNYPSEKNNAIKKWMHDLKFPYQISEFFDTVTGYVEGAVKGIAYNLPTLGFSTLLLLSKNDGAKNIGKLPIKHNTLKKLGVVGLGISMAYDFIVNGTNLTNKTDDLRKN